MNRQLQRERIESENKVYGSINAAMAPKPEPKKESKFSKFINLFKKK